jgi:hypothetical protein
MSDHRNDPSKKLNLADEVLKYIRENNLPPIVARDVYPEDQFQLFNNIKPSSPQRANRSNQYRVFTNVLLPSRVQLNGKLRPIFFTIDDRSYGSADRISDYYQEEERIKAYSTNRNFEAPNLSVHELWYNYDDIMKELISKSLNHVKKRYPDEDWSTPEKCYNNHYFKYNLMSSLYRRGIYVSQYRVSWVVSIIHYFKQFFNIESMMDPFAGWGDRLIGAMKLGIEYRGFDPNTALHPGYKRMIEDLADDQSKYSVEMIGFEDAVIEDSYDLVFTSPPYKDVEIYSHEETQSIIKFGDSWLEDFYIPSLNKAWDSLREGGVFILHICDTKTFMLVDHTMKWFNQLEDCQHLGQFMAYTNKSDYPNLHLVYQKN